MKYKYCDCTNLKSLSIGTGLIFVGEFSFARCLKLEKIYSYATRYPLIKENTFSDSYPDYVTLRVPARVVSKYKAHNLWGQFGEVIPLTDESIPASSSPVLTIMQATNGAVSLNIPKESIYTFRIMTYDDWEIHSVAFNDVDVTNQLDENNTFTTPAIMDNSTLSVVYALDDVDDINNVYSSEIKIIGTANGVRVTGAKIGDIVNVYSEDGLMLKTVQILSRQTDIDLKGNGVFIIKIGDKVVKLSR